MLNELLQLHKETVFFAEKGGSSVGVILKPTPSHEGYPLQGYTNFIGLDFVDGDKGFFGDSFELTINAADLYKKTTLKPVEGWLLSIKLPMMNDEVVDFYVQNVATDRTLGMYLLKCTATTSKDKGCKSDRNNAGGI